MRTKMLILTINTYGMPVLAYRNYISIIGRCVNNAALGHNFKSFLVVLKKVSLAGTIKLA